MKTLVGIFRSAATAEAALQVLHASGLPDDEVLMLTPRSILNLHVGPLPESHPHGSCGITAGHIAGAITGFAGGTLSGAVIILLVPGVGPLLATGALALASLIGVAVGAAVGDLLQKTWGPRLSYEDVLVYRDALRHGHDIVIVHPADDVKTDKVQQVFSDFGAENLEDARDHWWHRLRDSQIKASDTPHDTFTATEVVYLQGFEAAINPGVWGHSYEKAAALLRQQEPATYEEVAFRHGYERGQSYRRATLETKQKEVMPVL